LCAFLPKIPRGPRPFGEERNRPVAAEVLPAPTAGRQTLVTRTVQITGNARAGTVDISMSD